MALLQASHNLVPSAAIAFFTDASCDELRSYISSPPSYKIKKNIVNKKFFSGNVGARKFILFEKRWKVMLQK